MKHINLKFSAAIIFLSGAITTESMAQNTFPSPGSQVICSTTSPILSEVIADDGVSINASLRLLADCLDTNLATFSINSPASFRRPTFCYNNGYMPSSYGYPLVISRNSTANSGACAGGVSSMLADFSQGVIKPTGLSFILCDVDNTYDSVIVNVYYEGASIEYNFEFLEPDPLVSFAYSNNTTGRGSNVSFNGGANGVWGESSATTDFEKGAVRIFVDSGVVVDSVVVNHIIKNNRTDINAGISFGNFIWEAVDPLSIEISNFDAFLFNNEVVLQWNSELNNVIFEIERSKDGIIFETISPVNSKLNQTNYEFVDSKPCAGINFYRIKLKSIQNKQVYSPIRSLHYSSDFDQVSRVYPNPIDNKLFIQNKSNDFISIYNITGKKIYENNRTEVIDVSRWHTGVYIVQYGNGKTEKIIKK